MIVEALLHPTEIAAGADDSARTDHSGLANLLKRQNGKVVSNVRVLVVGKHSLGGCNQIASMIQAVLA